MSRDKEKIIVDQVFSRRDFIRTAAITAGVFSASGLATVQAATKTKDLTLLMAGYNFDRTKALIDGSVKIEGYDIQFKESGIEANRKTLEALFRYSYQQGLCRRELTIEELFEPTSLGFAES